MFKACPDVHLKLLTVDNPAKFAEHFLHLALVDLAISILQYFQIFEIFSNIFMQIFNQNYVVCLSPCHKV